MHRDGLREPQCRQFALLFPAPTSKRGRPRRPDRLLVDGMIWIARTGAPWRDLPERYGPRQTVYHRLTAYRRRGVWEQLLQTLQGRAGTSAASWTGRCVALLAPWCVPAFTRPGAWRAEVRAPSSPRATAVTATRLTTRIRDELNRRINDLDEAATLPHADLRLTGQVDARGRSASQIILL